MGLSFLIQDGKRIRVSRMAKLKKNFLNIRDLEPIEVRDIISLAKEIKANPDKFKNSLAGKKVGLYFQKPSMRTRVSFNVGIDELGGFPVNLLSEEIQIGKREPIKDVARVLSRYLDAIMLRVDRHSDLEELVKYSSIPVINGLSDLSHPCQGLADVLTILENKGTDFKKIVYFGDGNNVCYSLIEGLSAFDISITVCCPDGYEPSISRKDVYYDVVRDPKEAAKDADVFYTDTWISMGQEKESLQRRKVFAPYKVSRDLMTLGSKDAIFMHDLPAYRGDEVDDDVMESKASVVFQQAENRLYVQKAIMVRLLSDD